jgi:hypothetical protein
MVDLVLDGRSRSMVVLFVLQVLWIWQCLPCKKRQINLTKRKNQMETVLLMNLMYLLAKQKAGW